MKLTGNESLHFLFLKSLSCRVHLCGYLFKISDQFIENCPRYICKNLFHFWSLTLLLTNYLTLAGSRGSFDPKNLKPKGFNINLGIS